MNQTIFNYLKNACLTLSALPIVTFAEDAPKSAEDLAKDLANPVAALISVPFQLNYDDNLGVLDNGDRWTLNIQPVVPIDLNEEWNIISRTILPVIHQEDIFSGAGGQSGIGDIVQSVFFSPKDPTEGGWTWGVGPVFLLPTGTDDLLSAEKWGAGPTAVALRQQGPWTYGLLGNHIWSFAGDNGRRDLSATFLQPFVTYTTPTAWSFTMQTESTYDWKGEDWSVPVNCVVSKVTKIGDQLVSLSGGLGYWAESPDSGADGVRVRMALTLLFSR
ncbi:transporter [Porticoccaceae bacterium LTM1]|nr:transporter [Porticoccaceae bacterium LTM1]